MKINIEKRLNIFLPNVILNALVPKVCLAGGAIRAYLNNEKISDFDLFFLHENQKEITKEYFVKNKFKIIFECKEGYLTTLKHKNIKVQLISEKIYDNPEQIIKDFDFTCSQFCVNKGILYTTKNALNDTRNKKIRFNIIEYPAATLGRFYKFIKRGYNLDEKSKIEFVKIINENQFNMDFTRVYID